MTADTPTLLWQDATQIGVHCLVPHTPLADSQALSAEVCERVRAEVARDAALPVVVILPGDPALIAPGTVALLVHAAVQTEADEARPPQMAFVIRPYRSIADQQGPFFGASPETVSLSADGRIGAAFDRALRRTLAQTLPWRAETTLQVRPL